MLFFIIIIIEIIFSNNYRKKDTIQTAIFLSIFSLLYNLGTIPLLKYLEQFYNVRITNLSFINFLSASLVFDFIYYWLHRFEHKSKRLWFFHIHHHSSRFMNFFTGFRASYTQPIYMLLFLLPMILIGYSAELIIFSITINKIFNFWVHQKYLKKIPFLDVLFNTPSNHRVHHGRNPQYIDKNFGGILILWDKIFKTYEPEEEEVLFGVYKDPLQVNFKDLFLMGK